MSRGLPTRGLLFRALLLGGVSLLACSKPSITGAKLNLLAGPQVPGFESSPFTASADQSKLQVNDAVTASVVLTVT